MTECSDSVEKDCTDQQRKERYWIVAQVVAYKAVCATCECDIFAESDCEYACWSDPEGVAAVMGDEFTYCPKCGAPLTEWAEEDDDA